MPFQRRSCCAETPKLSATIDRVSLANFVTRDPFGIVAVSLAMLPGATGMTSLPGHRVAGVEVVRFSNLLGRRVIGARESYDRIADLHGVISPREAHVGRYRGNRGLVILGVRRNDEARTIPRAEWSCAGDWGSDPATRWG